eukprot:m.39949 g.39949  ORF g.39949 m.39949 type:complete len:1088 (-) comp5969_c0_seq2:1276-4539(-)
MWRRKNRPKPEQIQQIDFEALRRAADEEPLQDEHAFTTFGTGNIDDIHPGGAGPAQPQGSLGGSATAIAPPEAHSGPRVDAPDLPTPGQLISFEDESAPNSPQRDSAQIRASWYRPELTEESVEVILSAKRDGEFIVYEAPDGLTLALRCHDAIDTLPINLDDEGLFLDTSDVRFATIQDLVEHYRRTTEGDLLPVTLKTAEEARAEMQPMRPRVLEELQLLEQQPWFSPNMSQEVASSVLQGMPEGTFILRQRQSNSSYGLAYVNDGQVVHRQLLAEPTGIRVRNSTLLFADPLALIEHYSENVSPDLKCRLTQPHSSRWLVDRLTEISREPQAGESASPLGEDAESPPLRRRSTEEWAQQQSTPSPRKAPPLRWSMASGHTLLDEQDDRFSGTIPPPKPQITPEQRRMESRHSSAPSIPAALAAEAEVDALSRGHSLRSRRSVSEPDLAKAAEDDAMEAEQVVPIPPVAPHQPHFVTSEILREKLQAVEEKRRRSSFDNNRQEIQGPLAWCQIGVDPTFAMAQLVGRADGAFIIRSKENAFFWDPFQAVVQFVLSYIYRGITYDEVILVFPGSKSHPPEFCLKIAPQKQFSSLHDLLVYFTYPQPELRVALDVCVLESGLAPAAASDFSWCKIGIRKPYALAMLKHAPSGACLIRSSESRPENLVLSFVHGARVFHELINVNPGTSSSPPMFYLARDRRRLFTNLQDLIVYLRRHHVQGIGRLFLPEDWRGNQPTPFVSRENSSGVSRTGPSSGSWHERSAAQTTASQSRWPSQPQSQFVTRSTSQRTNPRPPPLASHTHNALNPHMAQISTRASSFQTSQGFRSATTGSQPMRNAWPSRETSGRFPSTAGAGASAAAARQRSSAHTMWRVPPDSTKVRFSAPPSGPAPSRLAPPSHMANAWKSAAPETNQRQEDQRQHHHHRHHHHHHRHHGHSRHQAQFQPHEQPWDAPTSSYPRDAPQFASDPQAAMGLNFGRQRSTTQDPHRSSKLDPQALQAYWCNFHRSRHQALARLDPQIDGDFVVYGDRHYFAKLSLFISGVLHSAVIENTRQGLHFKRSGRHFPNLSSLIQFYRQPNDEIPVPLRM